MKCCHRMQPKHEQRQREWTHAEIGNVLFEAVRGILMIKHAKLVLPSESRTVTRLLSLPHNLFFQSQPKEKSEKSWKNAEKSLKNRKKLRAIKCRLFRLPLTNCCYSNERLQHSPRKKQKLMIIIRFFSVCLCRANINFVHVNVSVHKWNYIWLGASSIRHTKNFNSR